MGMNAGGGGSLQSDINVTPLVDVVLVLLIIMMTVVPLARKGYDVDIPTESQNPPTPDVMLDQIVLGIDLDDCGIVQPPGETGLPANCSVTLGEETMPVSQLAGSAAALFEVRQEKDRVLFLSAAEQLNYEAVMQIVDLAKSQVGGLKIGLVTEAG